jgi:NMD protein affecting ribosome stability and mRNA decay
MTTFEPLEMTCMRCGNPAQMRFAGPCETCVAELSVRFPGVARDVETEEYVPKVNVTANAVALKDD